MRLRKRPWLRWTLASALACLCLLAFGSAPASAQVQLTVAPLGNYLVFRVQVGSTSPTPTGTFSILDGTTILVKNLPPPSAVWVPPISLFTTGCHAFTATYTGDANYAASTSTPVINYAVGVTACPAAPNVTVTCSTVVLQPNQASTCSANVAVTWSLSGAGSLGVAGGLATITAPLSIAIPSVTNLTATSNADATRTALVSIILSPTICSISQVCTSASTLAIQFVSVSGSAKQNIPYLASVSATGGLPPYVFSRVSGAFPVGIADVTATGLVSGTPTGTISGTETVSVKDAAGTVVNQAFTITPESLSSIVVTPATPTVAISATQQMVAVGTWSGGDKSTITDNVSWSSTNATQASVSSTGLVTGVAAGSPTIQASFNSITGNTVVTVPAASSNPSVSTASLPNAQVNILYPAQTLTCSGGSSPYTWSVSVGALPAGLSLGASTGAITGTPTGTTQTFTVKCTDTLSNFGTKSLTLTVATVTSMSSVTCLPSTITVGSTSQCTAIAGYSDGSTATVTSLVVGGGGSLSVSNVWNNLDTSGSLLTSLSVTVATTAGHGLITCVREGWNNTDAFTISDSAGQTWTQTTSGYGSTGSSRTGCFVKANSAALTSVTVNFTTVGGVGYDTITVLDIGGAASSGLEDSSVNSTATAATSITSGSLTTTNANDILVFWGGASSNGETAWTAGSGYAILNNNVAAGNNGSNSKSAIETQIVSAVQSGVTTSMSWSPASTNVSGIFVGLKGGGSGGTAWSTSSCTNGGNVVATVNGTGLVAGLGGGTCSITATLSGFSASATVTVNGPALTTISVSPANASQTLNVTTSFTATGNDGNNYTTTSVWASSAPLVASMAGNIATCLTVGASTISASVGAISGTAALSCTSPSGSGSLLTGMTPANFTLPPGGWSVLVADGFESGNISAWPSSFGHGNVCPASGSSACGVTVVTSPVNSGNFSAKFQYSRNCTDPNGCDDDVALDITPASINHIYVSGYVKLDNNNTTINSGNQRKLIYLRNLDSLGNPQYFAILTSFPSGNVSSSPNQLVVSIYPGNNVSVPFFYTSYNLPWGSWHQLEFEVQNSDPGGTNGFFKVWVDGQQISSVTNLTTRASGITTTGFNEIMIGQQVNVPSLGEVINELRYWDDIIILKK